VELLATKKAGTFSFVLTVYHIHPMDIDLEHHKGEATRVHLLIEALSKPLLFWSLPFVFLSFGLPIYGRELGASALEVGGLFSIFTATTLLLRPVVGWALDRFGRRLFFITALGLYSASMFLFAIASSLSSLYLARFIQGIGSSFFWVTLYTIVADLSTQKDRGRAMGWVSEITSRGGIIGGLSGLAVLTALSEGNAWLVAFLGYAVMSLAGTWLAWKNLPETNTRLVSLLQKERLPPALLKLMVVAFATGVSQAMIAPIFIIFLQDQFTTEIGLLALAALPSGLVSAFFAARLGSLSDRFGRVWMMAAGMTGSGILAILLPHLPTLLWLAVFYTLSGITWGLSEPAEASLVGDLTGGTRFGAGYGMYEMSGQLGFTIGPLLGGLLYDTVARQTPFYINGAVLVVGAVWVVLFLRNASTAAKKE
jgi:MFS transporter, DHA1 family, multidrug resistance protein